MAYKPDQGRLARMATFWMLWLLIIYGCTSFRYVLDGWTWLPAVMRQKQFAMPVLGDVSLNVALALLVIPGLTAVLLIRWLNKPKIADHLIEVETELRKVVWPSFAETRGASIVVIISVLILMAYLAGADFLLSRLFSRVWTIAG